MSGRESGLIQRIQLAFCLVLIFSLLSIVHLYIQEKDFRITYLQNEVSEMKIKSSENRHLELEAASKVMIWPRLLKN